MFLTRKQYDTALSADPKWMATMFTKLKRQWSLAGVEITGPEELLNELQTLTIEPVHSIRWHMPSGKLSPHRQLSDFSDEVIIVDRTALEAQEGEKLEVDPRTDFPSFVLYENGEEIGGG